MNNKITKEDRKKNEQYIAESMPCIEQLKSFLGKEGEKLDFTIDSLKFIDELASKKIKIIQSFDFNSSPSKLSDQESWLLVRIAYYVSEVLLKNLNTHWDLDKVKSSPSYKNSVIVMKGTIFKIDPLQVIFALIGNKRSIYEWYKYIEGKYKSK